MAQNNDPTVRKEITLGGMVYILEGTVDFKITPKGPTTPPGPDVPPIPPSPTTKPDSFGTIKEGAKWSKNPGPSTGWKLVEMNDNKAKKKFVAPDGLNVIADLESDAQAKAIQDYFAVNVFPPKIDGGTTDPGPDIPPSPTDPVPTGEGPYPLKGKVYSSTQRGPTTRHYASGAPDDQTIEKNVTKIQSGNHQMIVDITVPTTMEHDDNLSIKIGGNHMDNGWFDNGISIYEGQSCLGTEIKHPKTKKCIVKGKKYGDLRGKRVQVASTYFLAENKTEYWIKMPGGVWDKAAEGKDIGGFNSKTKEGEFAVQLRIDGFESKDKPPEIHSAIVQEI